MKEKTDIESYVRPFFSWIAAVVFVFAILPFQGQAQQTRRPVVPVEVKKYASPVPNPEALDNPNAWDVTLRVETGNATPEKADIVLVLDTSGSMGESGGDRIKYATIAAKEFIRKMLPSGLNTENVRVALVFFAKRATVVSDFTKDIYALSSEIDNIYPTGATNTQDGIYQARKLLENSSAPQKHIVLLADGEANIQYLLKNKDSNLFIAPHEGDDLVDLIDNSWSGDRLYSRSDLLESDYRYDNSWEDIPWDVSAHIPVYEWFPRGRSLYCLFPCNAAVNEAKFAKDKGITVHSIGLDTHEVANEALLRIATSRDHYHYAHPVSLITIFDNIAQTIRLGLSEGKVQDIVAPGFVIDNGGYTTGKIKVSQGTVSYNAGDRKILWNLGTLGKHDYATLTYRVYARMEDIQNEGHINPLSGSVPDAGGFDTNMSASLDFTNSNGEKYQRKEFPRPAVKLSYGYIKRHYVLVNEEGKPIKLDGSVVSSLKDAEVLQNEDFFLPTGGEHIAPKWIKMNKSITDPNRQKFSVTPSKKIIEYEGETYRLVEGSVSGSTPDGGEVGISWRSPVGNAYFAYVRVKNYWIGGTPGNVNAWNVPANWTNNRVPSIKEDVEFATAENNNGKPAKADLHLDNMPQGGSDGRVIGDLINASDKDLVITQDNQLTIMGRVIDGNPSAGTIVVKSGKDKPSGTLKFAQPNENRNVDAVVEFYSKAYDCENCGMYRRSWQYFGIPVQALATFPSSDVPGEETVNQWVEQVNGDKWQKAPHTPDTELKKFKGYEITNSSKSQPTEVYKMAGKLNVGNADVPLTRTVGVNYAGANLVGNSYTAAIHIKEALVFPSGVRKTVYLFNTGTRDQWRKLNGSTVSGYRGGQYLAVPVNTAGSGNLPDRIPSMQTFLVLQESGSNSTLNIRYDELVKNTTVNNGNGDQIVLRSAEVSSSVATGMPTLAMDVLGCGYADRVQFFSKEGTTDGYDDGWDGHKITESEHVQLYAISGDGKERFAVSTVPSWESLTVGLDAPTDGKYVAEFAVSGLPSDAELDLTDLTTDERVKVKNGSSYSFTAKRGDTGARFRISYSGAYLHSSSDPSTKIDVRVSGKGQMTISNGSSQTCHVSVSDLNGKAMWQSEVSAGRASVVKGMSTGIYVVRLQGSTFSQVRKMRIKD